jgi:uncharacterized protein YdhG (YjbR/CyaY superfamily)
MKARVPNTVDDYIGAQPDALRPKLQQVRAAIRRAVPEALEGIGYGMPGYKLKGKPLLYFAGFKQHYSLFAASGTFFASLEEELKDYERRKGTCPFSTQQTRSGETYQPDRKAACRWDFRNDQKRGAWPTQGNTQVDTIETACPASAGSWRLRSDLPSLISGLLSDLPTNWTNRRAKSGSDHFFNSDCQFTTMVTGISSPLCWGRTMPRNRFPSALGVQAGLWRPAAPTKRAWNNTCDAPI